MDTAKKGKLVVTLVIFALICVLVPLAIQAAMPKTSQIRNNVSFLLEDLEGKFGYGVYGTVKGNNSGDVLMPKLYFESALNTTTNTIELKNANGQFIADPANMELHIDGIEMDDKHRQIDFYFFYVNTANPDDVNPEINRDTLLTFEDNSNFGEYAQTPTTPGLSSSWSYCLLRTDIHSDIFTDSVSLFSTNFNLASPLLDWDNLNPETDSVNVGSKTTAGVYKMAVIKYSLVMSDDWDATNTFDENSDFQPEINLTINFSSAS